MDAISPKGTFQVTSAETKLELGRAGSRTKTDLIQKEEQLFDLGGRGPVKHADSGGRENGFSDGRAQLEDCCKEVGYVRYVCLVAMRNPHIETSSHF